MYKTKTKRFTVPGGGHSRRSNTRLSPGGLTWLLREGRGGDGREGKGREGKELKEKKKRKVILEKK